MFENMRDLKMRAERLARAHRAPFDAACDEWLEADTIDGAPDINRFMADGEDVLSEVLGADRYGAVRDAMARADRDQDWDVFDALSENEHEVYGAYLTEFEYGMK